MLLDDGQPLSERVDSIHAIIWNGKHLLQIINDILDLSKVEAGKLDMEQIEASPFALISDIEGIARLQAESKGLVFKIKHIFPLPEKIVTDPVRFKQILLNLCSNAIKFTTRGSVQLVTSYHSGANQLRVEVIDTGIGMSPEQQERLFAPFTQADSTTTRKYGGTGLGLYLSRQLAEKLGGTLELESTAGKGTTTLLKVNIGDIPGQRLLHDMTEIPVASTLPASPNVSRCSGHILLAEDNPDNQRLISMYIKKSGANLSVAENGLEAVQKALAGQFDLILMDMQMPVMDGISAIKTLRDQGYKGPIVALTANAMKEDLDRCYAAVCNGFLTKPVNLERFYETLAQFLKQEEAGEAPSDPIFSKLLMEEPEFADLVDAFAAKLPGTIAAIMAAFANNRWDELKKLVHDLKGVGGGMGYPQVTELSSKIEFEIAKKGEAALSR